VNDRVLLDDLISCNAVNEKIAKTAYNTFIHHLLYLGIDLDGFSLFSEELSMVEKTDCYTNEEGEETGL